MKRILPVQLNSSGHVHICKKAFLEHLTDQGLHVSCPRGCKEQDSFVLKVSGFAEEVGPPFKPLKWKAVSAYDSTRLCRDGFFHPGGQCLENNI